MTKRSGKTVRIALLLTLLAPFLRADAPQETTNAVDLRSARPGGSFESLWAAYRKAETASDVDGVRRLFEEIKRLRTERNIRSLEPLGLVFVGRGLEALQRGDATRAQEELERAIALDPHLPDAYMGLARSHLKQGPLKFVAAAGDVVSGLMARLPAAYGSHRLLALLLTAGLLGLLVATMVFGLVMVVRHGGLLLHDIEEAVISGRCPSVAMAILGLLLFLPVVVFQGYGWLPLWWLALLSIYFSAAERVVAVLLILAYLTVTPTVETFRNRSEVWGNPLYRAAIVALEGSSDARSLQIISAALRRAPEDRDLAYLLAVLNKKSGQYEESAATYRELLRTNDKDPIALNNLANLDFARQEFPAAVARYKLAKQAVDAGAPSAVAATVYYNLSLAHLQKFERQEADEARAQADRLGGGLIRTYESLWKYESRNENAVVDIALTGEQLRDKFMNAKEPGGRKNVMESPPATTDMLSLLKLGLNRFLGFALLVGILVFGLSFWRGPRMFTMRCSKCGTPFCKHCHLGAVPAGLCTQCYHLFVVRDGVSGPARNRKLLEVQHEDVRRERVFRVLSLVSPGAGHVYAQKTLLGAAFLLVWYFVLSLVFVGARLLPLTEVPTRLTGYYPWILAGLLLTVIYVAANRARPDFEEVLPLTRGSRRARA